MDEVERWEEMVQFENLVKSGLTLKDAAEKIAKTSPRTAVAITRHYHRIKPKAAKEDKYRTLKKLTLDEEVVLTDYLYGMSALDHGRSADDERGDASGENESRLA